MISVEISGLTGRRQLYECSAIVARRLRTLFPIGSAAKLPPGRVLLPDPQTRLPRYGSKARLACIKTFSVPLVLVIES
jgi:hypothetical protein